MRISDCSSVVCSSDLPDINFLLGDDLLDGGHTLEAAQEYSKTAYGYRAHIKAPEAAYAAVLAYQKYAKQVPAAPRPQELGSASCRERVCQYVSLSVVAVSLTSKQNQNTTDPIK